MAVSQQLEQKQRLSVEVERKRTQFESICREIFVLQKPLRFIDAELLDREVALLEAEVEQLQQRVDCCDAEEASITDGLNALSIEGGSPMLPAGSGVTVMNRPPRPPRPPPPRVAGTSRSPCPSSGSLTPGTPSLGRLFDDGAPSLSSSSSSTPSSSSSTPNGAAGGEASTSRLQRPMGSFMEAGESQPTAPNQPWTCSLCTFQNHGLMPECEICTLPKASGRRTLATGGCDDGSWGGAGRQPPGTAGATLQRQHLSVDTGVAAAAAAAAAAGASVGPATAPPQPAGHTASPSFITQPPGPQSGQQMQQQQQQQQQQPQSSPPSLQSAQYQKSSIEC